MKMKNKNDINKIVNLTRFGSAVARLNENLDTLRVEIKALLHDRESLRRENKYSRELLDEKN